MTRDVIEARPGWPSSGRRTGEVHADRADAVEAFLAARGGALVRFARAMAGSTVAEALVAQSVAEVFGRRLGRRSADRELQVRRAVLSACEARRRAGDEPPPRPGGSDVLALLRFLPVPQRAAVVARCYEGLDDREVAALLGTGPAAARRTLDEGLRRLGHLLPQEVDGR